MRYVRTSEGSPIQSAFRDASDVAKHPRKTSRKISRNDPYARGMRALLLVLALAACGKSKARATAPGLEAFEDRTIDC